MRYRIEILPSAKKELAALQSKDRKRIDKNILSLGDDPRPYGVKALKGGKNLYRLRVGDYRIIYEIRDRVLVVLIVRIGHRREVYR